MTDRMEQDIAALAELDGKSLRARWLDLYDTPAPAKVRPGFLRQAIAYRIQELAYGGLKPQTVKRLKEIVAGLAKSRRGTSKPAVILTPGMRLVREWNGATHVVDITANGFLWNGTCHRSLSAIARRITGTRWSGPRFFGIDQPESARQERRRR